MAAHAEHAVGDRRVLGAALRHRPEHRPRPTPPTQTEPGGSTRSGRDRARLIKGPHDPWTSTSSSNRPTPPSSISSSDGSRVPWRRTAPVDAIGPDEGLPAFPGAVLERDYRSSRARARHSTPSSRASSTAPRPTARARRPWTRGRAGGRSRMTTRSSRPHTTTAYPGRAAMGARAGRHLPRRANTLPGCAAATGRGKGKEEIGREKITQQQRRRNGSGE